MNNEVFRPWGLLPWLFEKLPDSDWSFFGCLSTEDRSLAAWSTIRAQKPIAGNTLLIQINDPESSRYRTLSEIKLKERLEEFERLGGSLKDIENHQLFEPTQLIVNGVTTFINHCTGNVVLDISSFPKRFFFPIIRLMLQTKAISSLIVTYTVPERYSTDSLSEDPEPWRSLPLFAPPYPEPDPTVFVIAMGFETLGLPSFVGDAYHNLAVKMLFPFPPGPPNFQRTWEFVRNVENNLAHKGVEPIRVDARDISDAFDLICSVTDHGKQYAIFAPYGPKPISLAIAIYATLKMSPVYYTQPRVYNPYYCSGIAKIDSIPEIYAYCLRLSGQDYYSLV